MTELTTPRLELRAWHPDDLDAYAAIVADREVTRYLGGPLGRPAAWRQMALFAGHAALRGWTQSALIERGSGLLIGRGGLWQPEEWPGLEIGWVLARPFWGRGYAREMALAVRDHAFRTLGADHLVSVIHPDNAASVRVAEAIGSRYERDWRSDGVTYSLYGQHAPG